MTSDEEGIVINQKLLRDITPWAEEVRRPPSEMDKISGLDYTFSQFRKNFY